MKVKGILVIVCAMLLMASPSNSTGRQGGHYEVDKKPQYQTQKQKQEQAKKQKQEQAKKQKQEQAKKQKGKNAPSAPEPLYVGSAEGNGVQDDIDTFKSIQMSLEYHVPSMTQGWAVSDMLEAPNGLTKPIHFRAKVMAKNFTGKNNSAIVNLYYSADQYFSREYDTKLDSKCIKLANWQERIAQLGNYQLELNPGRHYFFIDVIYGTSANISNNTDYNEFVEVVIGGKPEVVEPEVVEPPVPSLEPEIVEPPVPSLEPEIVEPPVPSLEPEVVEPEVVEPEETGITIANTAYCGQTTGQKWITVNMDPAEVWQVLAKYDVKSYLLKYVTITPGTGYHYFRVQFSDGSEKVLTFNVRS